MSCAEGQSLQRRAAALTQREDVLAAARLLRAGDVAAFPTETVFGLAALALRPDGAQRLVELKGRPAGKPLPVLVESAASALTIAALSARAQRAAQRLWPGPLTLVAPARRPLPAPLLGEGGTVGLRCPAHPLALALLMAVGEPLACTSANPSGSPPALRAEEALRWLGAARNVVTLPDEPPLPAGAASTVAVVGDAPEEDRLLRHGPISLAQLQRAAEGG